MPKREPRVWDAEMVARAAGLKRAGFPAKVIAARLGVSVSAVKNIMSTKGVKLRLDGRVGGNNGLFPLGPIGLAKAEAYNEMMQDFIDIKGEQ